MNYGNKKAETFFNQADRDLNSSEQLLDLNLRFSHTPYYSTKHFGASLLYPIVNAARMVKNLCKIAEGAVLLIYSLPNNPNKAMPVILEGMLKELVSFALNCLNTLSSLATLVTRTLSSVISFCLSNIPINQSDSSNGLLSNMKAGLSDIYSSVIDDEIMSQSLSL